MIIYRRKAMFGDDFMKMKCNPMSLGASDRTLYSFHSAKKIYFAKTPFKYLLLEKKETVSMKTVSLTARNTILLNSKDGMLLFSDR